MDYFGLDEVILCFRKVEITWNKVHHTASPWQNRSFSEGLRALAKQFNALADDAAKAVTDESRLDYFNGD